MTTAGSYFDFLKSNYDTAARDKIISKIFRLGNFVIQMNFIGPSLIPTFYQAFAHLAVEAHGAYEPSLTMNFWDEESSGSMISEIPWKNNEPDHLGLIPAFTDGRFFTLHQPGSGAIYMLDSKINELYYWVNSVSSIPVWESDFPLRMVFHWWLKDTAYQPVHAAAVGTKQGGVLLAGKGGSGKSTSTLLCVNSSLKIAGDDYVLLDCAQHTAYSLFALTKFEPTSFEFLTNLNFNQGSLRPLADGKCRFALFPDYSNSLIRQIPIMAVLLPEITTNGHTSIEPTTTGQAMLALAPTTLFQLPGLREVAFKKMTQFIRTTPAYRLKLGRDSESIPDILDRFISSLPSASKFQTGD